MSLSVLTGGLDTLEVSFMGQLAEEMVEKLDAAKAKAQELGEPVPFLLFPQEFMMEPSAFGKWRYQLKHPEVHLAIVNSTKVPCVLVQLTALGLAGGALDGLWAWVLAALSELGDMQENAVSRADAHVDFQGWAPTVEEMSKRVSTKLRFRPIYPNLDEHETYQFGKGAVVLRVYNKTREIEASKKGWMREVWAHSPDYDPSTDVWRIEAQLRRSELKRLSVNTSSQVFRDPGALLEYAMRERVSLRVPTGDKKRSRRPVDPRWMELRDSQIVGRQVNRLPVFARLLGWDQLVMRFLGIVATAAATREIDDFMPALQALSLAAEAKIIRGKYDWDAEVEKRRRRLHAQ